MLNYHIYSCNTLKNSGECQIFAQRLDMCVTEARHRRSKRRGWEVLGFVCKFENASLGHIFSYLLLSSF